MGLKDSLSSKKANVDDPLSRIDPSAPLVPLAQLPGALASESKDSNESMQHPESPSGKAELKPLADDKLTDMDSDMERSPALKRAPTHKGSRKLSKKERINLERILESDSDIDETKESDLDRILNFPVKKGPPQNQKDVTDFFLRDAAMQKKRLQDSIVRRRERGPDWY